MTERVQVSQYITAESAISGGADLIANAIRRAIQQIEDSGGNLATLSIRLRPDTLHVSYEPEDDLPMLGLQIGAEVASHD